MLVRCTASIRQRDVNASTFRPHLKIVLEVQVMAHVVVHRIFSLSVSLPVRGADGLAKRAPYGGVERQRLSSQSLCLRSVLANSHQSDALLISLGVSRGLG